MGFYAQLGFSFEKHAHGKGPTHYASDNGSFVFEIYPQVEGTESTKAARIGFKIPKLDETLPKLIEAGAMLLSPAKDSPWGRRAVISDPIGHKIELVEDVAPQIT